MQRTMTHSETTRGQSCGGDIHLAAPVLELVLILSSENIAVRVDEFHHRGLQNHRVSGKVSLVRCEIPH